MTPKSTEAEISYTVESLETFFGFSVCARLFFKFFCKYFLALKQMSIINNQLKESQEDIKTRSLVLAE